MDRIDFFHADFRDGRVHMAGKSYPAGFFSTFLLNHYYHNNTAARVAVFVSYNLMVQNELSQGYVNASDFCACAGEIQNILKTLPTLYPFALLDVEGERRRIAELFAPDNADLLMDYFQRKSKVAGMDAGMTALGLLPPEYDKRVFHNREQLLQEVQNALHFYSSLGDDLTKAFQKLRTFVSRVDEAERYDEVHLLPIALEVFGQAVFPVSTQYIPVRKRKGSKDFVLAKRMYFGSFYSFILADFFEGLHHGHYPRRCGVCGKYFLMQSAVRQKYCGGYAPEKVKGKTITCRKYAARLAAKELAEGDPVLRIYRNRCACIRVERNRGTIVSEFAAMATDLARQHMQHAREDDTYAAAQYPKDMSRDRLYAEADRAMR